MLNHMWRWSRAIAAITSGFNGIWLFELKLCLTLILYLVLLKFGDVYAKNKNCDIILNLLSKLFFINYHKNTILDLTDVVLEYENVFVSFIAAIEKCYCVPVRLQSNMDYLP